MLIRDLLEELQKHGEEEIGFYLVGYKIDKARKLVVLTHDNHTIVKVKDEHGNPTGSVALTLWDDNAKTL